MILRRLSEQGTMHVVRKPAEITGRESKNKKENSKKLKD